MLSVETLRKKFYDNQDGWQDGTQRYLALVFRYAGKDDRVLDIGAGNGRGFVHSLRGRVKEVVGLDPDVAVLSNTAIDRGIIGRVEDMPFSDGSFDIAVSSFTLEHIENPALAATEIWRVLRPGGYFIFRTPNLWHYTTSISRLTPHWFHRLVANWARDLPNELSDPYPTRYRCNTVPKLRKTFASAGFSTLQLATIEPEPSYMQFSWLAFLLGVAYERLVSSISLLSCFRVTVFGVFRKHDAELYP